MRPVELLTLSTQSITLYTALVRLLKRLLKENYGIRYNEFVAIALLYKEKDPVLLSSLSNLLVLEEETVQTILLSLEDQGFVQKAADIQDRRHALCSLTDKGQVIAESAGNKLYGMITSEMTDGLPADEFPLFSQSVAKWVEALRGCSIDKTVTGQSMVGDFANFLILWRVVIDRCSKQLHETCELSLTEYRILKLLGESNQMTPAGIADILMLDRGNTSVCLKRMGAAGLVESAPNPFDARSSIVRVLRKGREAKEAGDFALDNVVSAVYQPFGADSIDILGAWYPRLYRNVRRLYEQ